MDFSGKTVLITGGNSGIGFAIAKHFKGLGANVAISGRSADKLQRAQTELGTGTIAREVDVNSVQAIAAFVDEVVAAHGKIDVVVASAGGATVRPFEAMDEAIFDEDLGRNFKGAYFTAQLALPHLSKGSSIVFLGSAAGQKGMPGMSVYGPSKAALRNLTRVLAAELGPKGIRTNIVSPGPIPTPGMDRIGLPEAELEAAKQMFAGQVPLGRMGTVDEMAHVVTFLASEAGGYINGSEIAADGGMAQV